jgi:hypothetical protein
MTITGSRLCSAVPESKLAAAYQAFLLHVYAEPNARPTRRTEFIARGANKGSLLAVRSRPRP